MVKYNKIEDAIKRLEELIELEGSELGEAWQQLIDIHSYSYCLSTPFNAAVIKEIFKQAEDSHKNFEIVEEEEIINQKIKHKILKEK